MSRTLPASIVTKINGQEVKLAYLVKLETSTAIKLTNHSKDITYNSDTYLADGTLGAIQEITETGTLQYSNMQLQILNPSDAIRNIFLNEGYVNKNATIYTAFLNNDETILESFEFFVGQISASTVADSEKGLIINIELSNQFRDWEIVKGRRFTDKSQQDAYPGDLGMGFAHIDVKDLRWGS